MKIALTLLLLLCAVPAWAAPVPFIDVNCNGVFDAGDEALDVGVPGSPPRSLVILTEECLVVPKGSVSPKPWSHVYVRSDKRVTWNTNVATNGNDAEAYLWIKGAPLTIANGVVLSAGGGNYIGSEGNGPMVIGDSVRITSGHDFADVIDTGTDGLFLGKGVVTRAATSSRFFSGGVLHAVAGLNVLATDSFGQVQFDSLAGIDVTGATLKANSVVVTTAGVPLLVRQSRVLSVFDDGFAQIFISSQYFPDGVPVQDLVDVRGTTFAVEPFIIGDPILR